MLSTKPKQTTKPSISELIQEFNLELDLLCTPKSLLFDDYKDTQPILKLWEHSVLRDWFMGYLVNFNEPDEVSEIHSIPLAQLIKDFESLLSIPISKIVNDIWDAMPYIRDWFSGKIVNFGYDEFGKAQTRMISPEESIKNFTGVLKNANPEIIKLIWYGNPTLRDWFNGKRIYLGEGASSKNKRPTISTDNLMAHYKIVLLNRLPEISKLLWDENPVLQSLYRGEKINLGYNRLGALVPYTITNDELLANFKVTLLSNSQFIIDEMWDRNQRLKSIIKKLNPKESLELRQLVLSNGARNFINDYFAFFSHKRKVPSRRQDGPRNKRPRIDTLSIFPFSASPMSVSVDTSIIETSHSLPVEPSAIAFHSQEPEFENASLEEANSLLTIDKQIEVSTAYQDCHRFFLPSPSLPEDELDESKLNL